MLDLRLERNAELAADALQLRDLAVGEAGGPVGEPRADDAVLPDAAEAYGEQQVIGAAKGAKLLEQLEINERRLAGEPSPQHRQAMGQGVADGAALKLFTRALVGTEQIDLDALLGAPTHGADIIKRVQHAIADPSTQDRHTDAAQALAQLAIERRGLGFVQRLFGKPLDDAVAEHRRGRCLTVHATT